MKNGMNGDGNRAVAVRTTALLLALGAFQCIEKPMEPVMPRWDVDLSAPILSESYTLAEIAEKDPDLLQTAPGSTQLMLKTSVQAPPTFVGDRISLDPISSTFTSELGPFTVKTEPFALPIYVPGLTSGTTAVIPPIAPTDVPAVAAEVPLVESAVLQSGTVTVRIQNRMPVAMVIEQPMVLVNVSGGTIAQFDFGTSPIPAGGERSVTANLAGATVRKDVRLQNLRVSSPGSGLSSVTIPDPHLVATVTPSGLVASSATLTSIDPQHTEVTRTVPLSSQSLVQDVWINRGTLNFNFVSTVGLPATLRLRVRELFTPSGQPYEREVTIGPRDSQAVSVDLAQFRLHNPQGGFVRMLTAEVTADVQGVTGSSVTVNSTDFFRARVLSSTVIADSAIAALQPTVVAIDQKVGLNLGDIARKFKGSLDIPNASMRFTPLTTMSVPMELNLRVEARDGDGDPVSLQMPVTKSSTGLLPIDFASGDVGNFLTRVSGNIPDSLRVIGSVVLNPDYDTTMLTHVGRNGSFAGDVDMWLPMSLRIVEGCFADTVVMGDTTADGNPDHLVDPETMRDVNSGRMHLEIDNGLPMAVKVKIMLLDKDHRPVLTLPQTEGDSLAIDAGIVMNGDVQATTHSSRVIELTGTEVTLFNSAMYVKMGVGLATPGDAAVNFRTTDRVHVRVWSEFSYRVNP